MLPDGFDKFFRRRVDAEIDDFEPGALQHNRHEIFADVVHVAFDGAEHDTADGLHAAAEQMWLENIHRRVHHTRRLQHLGKVHFPAAHLLSDHGHPGNQTVIENCLRREAVVEQALRQHFNGVDISLLKQCRHLL